MHFYCKCGNRISDTTDFIPYKAHLIADQDFDDLLESIEQLMNQVVNNPKVLDKSINTMYDLLYKANKSVYQCEKCGNLFIDGKGNTLEAFQPETDEMNKHLLQSIKGEKWKGFLVAEWNEIKPDWSDAHGHIFIETLTSVKGYETRSFNDYEVFEKSYYDLLEVLTKKEALRRSSLKKDRQLLHEWKITS